MYVKNNNKSIHHNKFTKINLQQQLGQGIAGVEPWSFYPHVNDCELLCCGWRKTRSSATDSRASVADTLLIQILKEKTYSKIVF